MGLGSAIAGMIGGAIKAASSASKNSSKSSGSSSKSSGSSSGSSNRNNSSSSVRFDSSTDYQAKINDAVSRGDYASAARYEQQRNAKIDAGQGGNSQKTNNYSHYLSSTGNPNGGRTVNGTYIPLGTHNDASLSAADKAKIEQYKQQYNDAAARGDTAGMQAAHQAAENIRIQNGYYGGLDGSDYISTGYGNGPQAVGSVDGVLGEASGGLMGSGSLGGQMMDYNSMLQEGFNQYRDYMEQAAAQQRAELQAKVDAAVAQLNAQRGDVGRLTAENNAAAERAYMQTIAPNGSLAENLAANGLLTSGATETSQIQAGNTYQNALNANARTEAEAIAQLEQAITQAQLTGDIEAANAYADVLQQIAEKGYQNVQDILAANQWQQQFDFNQATTEAGLTGSYNGTPTLEAQRLQMEKDQYEQQKLQIQQQLQLGQIDIQTAQKQLAMYDQQIAMLEEEIRGQQLANTAAELQNKYYQMQM